MRNIKVAIIDDKVLDSDRLLSLLNNYFDNSQDYSIQAKVFATAFQFLDEFSNNYDLLFLDINMPQMNGLELANKIREINNNIALIFVTNYASLAIDGYGVDALGFIVKPVKQIELNKVVDKFLKRFEENIADRKLVIKIKSGYQTLYLSQIKYIEVNVHDIFIYTTQGTFKTRGTLKLIEKELSSPKIEKCSNCFLINLDYVESIMKDDIIIDGKRIKIARNRKKDFLDAFVNYYK